MMTLKAFRPITVMLASVLWLTPKSWAQDQVVTNTHTIMHPDYATRLKWYQAHEAMPKAPQAVLPAQTATQTGAPAPAAGSSFSLLSDLDYVPSQRNQGACGDCWCWAGTGCMEILLDLQNGIFDRLSEQEVNSCETPINGVACCAGGWLSDLASFYSAAGYQRAIPWSNPGASWKDGGAACVTPCSSITNTPNYPIQSIAANSITTYGVSRAQAIANIKAILNQNIPVWFGFWLATGNDWSTFDSFWDNQAESATINLDFGCGHTWDSGGGGHAVLCVGYNDTDTNNPYWIMVNSWGTTGTRPDGIFHVSMTNNYSCTYYDNGYTYSSYLWEYLSITYTTTCQRAITTISSPAGAGTITGGGSALCNSNVTVCASPTSCAYNFVNWTDQNSNVVSTSACYTFTATTNRTLVANFNQITYTINTSSSPPAGGSTSGRGSVACGLKEMVCASPASCYNFVNWTDQNSNVVSTSACYTFSVLTNENLVANFAPTTYTISTGSSPSAGGSTSGGGVVACGSNVTVCASPAACYAFANWTDQNSNVVSTSACYTFTPEANSNLTARFAAVSPYTISTTGSPGSGGSTIGGGTVACGSNVTVCATPNACYNFVNWTDQNSNVVSTSECYNFTAAANEALVANFKVNGGSISGSVTTLWTFTNGVDGANANSYAPLVQGSDGNFYGTTYGSGSGPSANGTVFRITASGSLSNLHSFVGSDGVNPEAGLVQGDDGNFYGTTYDGGASGYGTVFRITPSGSLTTLWTFTNGVDGANSYAPLIQGSDGNLYGTTYGSGSGPSGNGTVFRITSSGSLSNLWGFTGGSDGANPSAGLVQGSDGNFYGTTYDGGASGYGTVFRITPSGSLTTLWTFTNGVDGANSYATLVQGDDGNFYGTTFGSGSGPSANGTVFRITPSGNLTNLWGFTGCSDGGYPNAGLVQGSDGNFYGTTSGSGSGPSADGSVFQISPNGNLTILHSFGGSEWAAPSATLVQGSDGSFYGTTAYGGNGYGTVFQLSIPLNPPANQISAIQVGGSNIVLTLPAVAGETYQLQFSASMSPTNWINIAGVSITNCIGGPLSLTNFGGALQPQGFYRFGITP